MKKFILLLILLLSSVACNAQLSGLGNVPLTPPIGGGSSLPFSSITISGGGMTVIMTPDDLIQELRAKSIPGFLALQGKLFGETNYITLTPTVTATP